MKQHQLYEQERQKIADINNFFMELVQNKEITSKELRKHIECNPKIWKRFEHWIDKLD